MTAVLLCSDSHGALDERVLALAQRCDQVVHAGDVGNAAVLERLEAAAPLLAVRGNNDVPEKWPAQDRPRLAALPAAASLALPGGELQVVHGDRVLPARRRHDLLRRRYPQARAILYGHSHHLCVDEEALPWVLNPGACGRARTFGGPSCLLLQAGPRRWRVQIRRFT